MHKFRVLIGVFFFLNLSAVSAQEEVTQRSYDFVNWRVQFQMNGPSNWNAALNFTKPINNRWTLRFGINPIISFNRTVGENPDLERYSVYETKVKNKKLGAELSIGGEFHLLQKGKIDPYLIFGTGIGGFAEISTRERAYKLIAPVNNELAAYENKEISKGAPQITIKPFGGFGFNYFFHPRVAFGIEYSLSPNMVILKGTGKTKIEEKSTFQDGSILTETDEIKNKSNAFFTNFNQQIGFHMIYVLKKKSK